MAFIVLGVGALMVAAGAGEIYYGSGFLEIERGWSTFIAGTILLTGGVLTMALGLALRSFGEFRGALQQLGGMDGRASLPQRGAPEIAIPAREPPVALRPAESAAALAAGGAALQIEPHFGGTAAAIEAEQAPPPLRLRDEPDPSASATPAVATMSADETRSDSHQLDPVARFEDTGHDEVPPATGMSERRGEAFVEPPGVAPPEPEPLYADYVELPEAALREHAPAAAETIVAPVLAPQPAVIGRYEAEGTSYVMYADGSIEAQSEAGVYRFASMAELKSFIET